MRSTKAFAVLLLVLAGVPLVSACSGEPRGNDAADDDAAEPLGGAGSVRDGTPEATGVLHAANSLSEAALVQDVHLTGSTAKNVVARRQGTDGLAGTSDDHAFASITELDAVPGVGPHSLALLLAYAQSEGWVGLAANLYGFTDGTRVSASGAGTDETNIGPSYECHRRTYSQLPCAGWAEVHGDGGDTVVTVAAVTHDVWYSGRYDQDDAKVRSITAGATITLDATGNGSVYLPVYKPYSNTSAGQYLDHYQRYTVHAAPSAVIVTYETGAPGCNSDVQTCTFTVGPNSTSSGSPPPPPTGASTGARARPTWTAAPGSNAASP